MSSPLIFPSDYLSVPLLSNFLNLIFHFTDMAISRVHYVPPFNKFFFLTVTFVNTQSYYPYANRAVKGFQTTSPATTCKLMLNSEIPSLSQFLFLLLLTFTVKLYVYFSISYLLQYKRAPQNLVASNNNLVFLTILCVGQAVLLVWAGLTPGAEASAARVGPPSPLGLTSSRLIHMATLFQKQQTLMHKHFSSLCLHPTGQSKSRGQAQIQKVE